MADESVDADLVTELRVRGHTVDYVAEMAPGIPDELVLAAANVAGAVLLTADKDFGDLVFLEGMMSKGVFLIRLQGLTSRRKSQILGRLIDEHGDELSGAFTVVSPGLVRIRRRDQE